MDAELVPKPLLFSHLAMLVPFIVRGPPWGMLGLALLTLTAVGKDRKIKCSSVSEEAHQHPSPAQKLLQAYLLDVPHSENLYFSVHQIGTVPLFFNGTPAHMSWKVEGKRHFLKNLCQGSAQKQ